MNAPVLTDRLQALRAQQQREIDEWQNSPAGEVQAIVHQLVKDSARLAQLAIEPCARASIEEYRLDLEQTHGRIAFALWGEWRRKVD
jgi:hypothetical protein